MPTDSELKAAAERLRSIVPDERMWDEPAAQWSDIDKDLWVCAFGFVRHILAQRADDDEEVDADFLVEVGMRPMASHKGAFETPDGVVIFNPWEFGWVVCNGRPKIDTRGQLRQLLSALGVQSGGDEG